MHYTSFRIQNFKGIRDTTVRLSEQSKVGVYAFVGLNESGKTTILEAIHSFAPNKETSDVLGSSPLPGTQVGALVPRHLISNFTGDVSVAATISVGPDEWSALQVRLKKRKGLTLREEDFRPEVVVERHYRFANGDHQASYLSLRTELSVRTGRQRKWRSPEQNERVAIRDAILESTPEIAYFPTFVFDFPDRIFLTEGRGGQVSSFYRRVFQDILDYDGHGLTIEDAIVRRVRSDDKKLPWLDFFGMWNQGDDRDKIQHVMDRASATVTEVVFGRWDKIFGEDARGKEIHVSFDTVEGEVRDGSGSVKKTHEHDLYIKFQIKDGTRRFDVNDRSLGFRWFFAFMLFTQFRVAREKGRPILFLFDEPASNLHAAAQQKLIDSFPAIARDDNTLAYTTHSHYMIEPKWLDQTFIVTNRDDAPSGSMIEALSLADESLDIKATKYGQFVSDHPGQTSFFQPVLDRLHVVPSRFDLDRRSLIVEGKSDYYILRYLQKLLALGELPIVPGLGAGTLGALVALHLGWGLNHLFLFDSDKKGKEERERYQEEYGLAPERSVALSEVDDRIVEIEDLLDDDARTRIRDALGLGRLPSKKQIRRFFQESLARDEIVTLGRGFSTKGKRLLTALRTRLDE